MNPFVAPCNKEPLIGIGLLSLLVLLSVAPMRSPSPQFGLNFYWADSIRATTTPIDCTFSRQWRQVVIKTDTIALWFRAGAPDTSSWSSRDWIKLDAGESISFGTATPLKRLEFKADAGTGYVFSMGYKNAPQY